MKTEWHSKCVRSIDAEIFVTDNSSHTPLFAARVARVSGKNFLCQVTGGFRNDLKPL